LSGYPVTWKIVAFSIAERENSIKEKWGISGVPCLGQWKGDTETAEIGELKKNPDRHLQISCRSESSNY